MKKKTYFDSLIPLEKSAIDPLIQAKHRPDL